MYANVFKLRQLIPSIGLLPCSSYQLLTRPVYNFFLHSWYVSWKHVWSNPQPTEARVMAEAVVAAVTPREEHKTPPAVVVVVVVPAVRMMMVYKELL